jgi:hypothetical protein
MRIANIREKDYYVDLFIRQLLSNEKEEELQVELHGYPANCLDKHQLKKVPIHQDPKLIELGKALNMMAGSMGKKNGVNDKEDGIDLDITAKDLEKLVGLNINESLTMLTNALLRAKRIVVLRSNNGDILIPKLKGSHYPHYLIEFGMKKAWVSTQKLDSLLDRYSYSGQVISNDNHSSFTIDIPLYELLNYAKCVQVVPKKR